MTPEDILDLLPIVSYQKWLITAKGEIRNEKNQCPICALVSEIDSRIQTETGFLQAVERLLRKKVGYRDLVAISLIVAAADYAGYHYRPHLLEALNLGA